MGWPRYVALALFLGLFVFLQWSPALPEAPLDDKAGHALLYFVFAAVVWPFVPLSNPFAKAGATVCFGFLVGLVMESGQSYIPNRHADGRDVWADLAGLLLASGAMAWSRVTEPKAKAGPEVE